MATYKITLTCNDRNIATVRNKLKQHFGGEGTATKIDTSPSRATRLSDAEGDVNSAKDTVESLKDELEEWHGNLPENLQEGEKAQQLQDAIDALGEIYDALDGIEWGVEFPQMMG